MNYDLLLLVLFYIFLLIIFKIYRNKFEVQWKIFALYKTKFGVKLMDKIAKKYPNFLIFLGYISIFVGFLGMVVTLFFIIYSTFKFLFVPETDVALAPLLPGVAISDKLPVLSFWHWIIAILIVAIIHEFSHGVYARLRNVKIKSTGFAFLGPILAAFVEPDEKQLKKKSVRDQLFVLSAGPFSNIISGILIFLILAFVFLPMSVSMVQINGIVVGEVNSSLPIAESGIISGHIIEEIDYVLIKDSATVSSVLATKKPGDTIDVKANGTIYDVMLAENPQDKNKAILGISFSKYSLEIKEKFSSISWLYPILRWFVLLLFWMFNISIGVGLFNLLPLGPVDGGRMFYAVVLKYIKDEKKTLRILSFISILILLLILINLAPFILRLLKFIISPF